MPRLGISMRWWLALAFALIAAVTAIAVAQVFSQSSEGAFRKRAGELTVGASVEAAEDIASTAGDAGLEEAVRQAARRQGLSLFVFDGDGRLVSSPVSRGVNVSEVPGQADALAAIAEGRRFIASDEDVKATVVGLPVFLPQAGVLASGSHALLAYAPRPGLATDLGIVREEIVQAALWAVLVGAVVGLLVAMLITARLRRIAAAAATIEAGSFDESLRPRFRDELGALASTVDRMRERLRESFLLLESERDRLSRLLERLQDGVITVNRELEIEFANASARRLLGHRLRADSDSLPEPWEGFSLREFAEGLFAAETPVAQARISLDPDRTFALAGLPARRPTENAVLLITDISELERRERAEREFVTNAAHELRTPLAAITGAVEVLQQGAKEIPEERDRFLAHVERETARLGRLTRALLVLARAQTREETPRLARVELRPLLEDVTGGLRPADGVELEVRCPPDLAALAERDLLEQALANLAANAVKHTARGRILFAASPNSGSVVIEVRDTGIGVSRAEQERIFDRFFRGSRRDADGFGLGLAIAREAVRTLGGTIEVDSTPGTGTNVRIVLSAAAERAA